MKIADKIAFHTEEPTNMELKYLLWLTLIELSKHTGPNIQTIDSDESFDCNKVLDGLDVDLGVAAN